MRDAFAGATTGWTGRAGGRRRRSSPRSRGSNNCRRQPELALAYSYHAQVRMLMPDYPTGIAQAHRAIEVADQVGSIEAKVHALNNLGVSLVGIGEEAGVADVRESLRLGPRAPYAG